MYKAGPAGLIQGDFVGNDVDFDAGDVFWMCAISYGSVGGYAVKGGLPLSRITLKLWAAIPEMEGRANISSEQLLNTSNISHAHQWK